MRKSCISFQNSTNPDSRLTGVFDLRDEWVQELRDLGVIATKKVDTRLNVSDLLTKCHDRARYQELCNLVRAKPHVSAIAG